MIVTIRSIIVFCTTFLSIWYLAISPLKLSLAQSVSLLPVEVEIVDGYQQVYIQPNGEEKRYISRSGINSVGPKSSGDYIVWITQINGEGQIFRYHTPTESLMQLTNSSVNLNPTVSEDGMVAWEHWDGDGWVIYLFDGLFSRPITDANDVAINPYLEDGYLAYGVRNPGAAWTARVYSIFGRNSQDIAVGAQYKQPELAESQILFNDEPFLFTVDDLFALDLPPLQNQLAPLPIITAEDILKEVEDLLNSE